MRDEVRFFLPGYLGRAQSYERGLPAGWDALQAPRSVRARGSLGRTRDWLVGEVEACEEPVVLGGHSMGAGVAILAASRVPDRVRALVLVAPSGLPISKPTWRIVYDFMRQIAARRYHAADVLPPLGDAALHPRAAIRLGRTLRALDLSREMARVREAAVPAMVIGCSTDTMTPPAQTRRIAELLGAHYREVDLPGGHVWMFGSWHLLADELERAMVALPTDTGGASP